MSKIDGAVYEIETDDDNGLQGILFQDRIMKLNFEKYSDFVMFDATYKLNDRQMPLTIMLVVDNHGESQIAALLLTKTENSEYYEKLLTKFKIHNPEHTKIETIMTDKSMANIKAFHTCFPNAAVQLCIFHVLQIFRREVTIKKRDINAQQKEAAQSIMKKMLYANNEVEYMEKYAELEALNVPSKYDIFSAFHIAHKM